MTQFDSKEGSSTESSNLKVYTLDGFLRLVYIPLLKKPTTKIFVILLCVSMFIFGCVGLYRSKLGLELADVLPEHTAPAAFLKAREEYFSFYPIFLIPNGPLIDYPNQQLKLEELRRKGKNYVVVSIIRLPPPPKSLILGLPTRQSTLVIK